MRKYKWVLIAMVGFCLTITGCSVASSESEQKVDQSEQSIQETGTEVETVEASSDNDSGEASSGTEKGEFSRSSMVMGKIVTVYGNYIQIDKVAMPERDMTKGEQPEGEQKTQTSIAGTGQGMSRGQGGPPGGGGRGMMGENSNYETSGEIVDVMIPVGAKITSRQDADLELTYDSLKKGMILRIVVDEAMTEEYQDTTEAETFYADSVSVINQ